jgi:uncharacterized alkaline shock family protein YloU
MSEREQYDSPLVTERGVTTISDSVVSQIAGMAAREVEGVHMGGSASRTASGVLSGITGSESTTRGVSAEIGTVEAALDLTMGIEYGRNILQIVEEVRRRISERVQNMTGLRVTELNVTISDIIFPEGSPGRTIAVSPGANAETQSSPESEATTASLRNEGASEPPEGDETAELSPADVSEARHTLVDDETRGSGRSEEGRA